MARTPWQSGLWWALVVVAVGAFWLTFAPTVAGGRSTYVIVAGASMEPALRRGDLVIARRAPDYQVGDIVTYRHPTVGPVIHRIIEKDDGTYTLQGDANGWTDSYHPAAGEILGRAWIRLPAAGKVLTWLRLPPILGLLALAISVLVVTMVWPTREKALAPGPSSRVEGWLSGWAESASTLQFSVFILGLVALLGLLLAVPAWSRPLLRDADRVYPYSQAGAFAYSARVPSAVYGATELRTGQPAYLKLTQRLNLDFGYAFESVSPATVGGTIGLAVEISDINGWERRLVLQEPQPFEGSNARVQGVLDLRVIAGYLDALEEQTGVTRPYYTLSILPTVQAEGVVAGLPLATTFEPKLDFLIDDLQVQLAPVDPTAAGEDPLAPRQEAAVETTGSASNFLTLLGVTLKVAAARWISGLALLLGLGGLGILAWFYLRSLQRDPLAAIRLKYGAQLVEMSPDAFEIGGATTDVASLDDLARVAGKHGGLMYWVRSGRSCDFFVPTEAALYAFRVAAEERASAGRDGHAPAAASDGRAGDNHVEAST